MTTPRKKAAVSTPEEGLSEVLDSPNNPRGVFTSEFILAALVLLIAGAIVLANQAITGEDWMDFAKWVVGGYAVSRGLAKVKV